MEFYEKMFNFGLKLTKENFKFHFEGVDDIEFVFTLFTKDDFPIQVRFIKGYGVRVLIGYSDLILYLHNISLHHILHPRMVFPF